AAVYVKNDPTDPEIPSLVRKGYIVRTRADSNLKEAIANDTTRREKAFASGAQLVTTDFPPGEAHEQTGYVVAIEGGKAARVNPVAGE
ncbi:MAG: phosphatidylinositol-specific phospholipase C1-like protein, partial [Candidatus Hydrogenedentes bacterium]|nr:phosphatidylinositol-specific phospholipase C1-like protein [Candidatus Hydrogenedentota bacterium]